MTTKTKIINNDLILTISKNDLNVIDTLDCGQAFRFVPTSENEIEGIAFNKYLKLTQTETEIIFHDTTVEEFENIWKNYFDLNTDYVQLRKDFSKDEVLKTAIEYASGIRILQQDKFEILLSFIISQNNNIKRIKTSIDKMCKLYGTEITPDCYAFPTLKQLENVHKSDLSDLGLGYRDDYIVDCVHKLQNNEIDLDVVAKMSLVDAKKELLKIKGVGPKVCDCVLLFGFYKTECFPVDTWIKKVLAEYYPNGFPSEYSDVAGIAQQYLFHYMRTKKD